MSLPVFIFFVAFFLVFIVIGAVGAFLAVKRAHVRTSGQTVTPKSVDFWVYLLGYLGFTAFGVYGVIRIFFIGL